MPNVILHFADGESASFEARPDQPILKAAYEAGLTLAKDCEMGDCQTCRAQLVAGKVEIDPLAYVTLEDHEIEAGAVLTCVSMAASDVEIRLPYARSSLIPVRTFAAKLAAVERVAANTYILKASLNGTGELVFRPGQYVNIEVPGTGQQRSFSMANGPETARTLEFYVRALPRGAMSDYVRSGARPGETLKLTGPHGIFYLRSGHGPVIFVAGGTGLAPIVSMLRHMVERQDTMQPVLVCFGVNVEDELFLVQELQQLGKKFRRFELRVAVARPANNWQGPKGYVTDLLTAADIVPGAQVYLCGPPPMIDAARRRLSQHGLPEDQVFTEQFIASGN